MSSHLVTSPRARLARSRWLVLALLLGACTTPELKTHYRPLHPDNGVDVKFHVEATDESGIRAVELYLYEYEVGTIVDGLPSGTARPGGVWGMVETWTYSSPYPKSIDETYVHSGFPASTYVTYLFRVTQILGGENSESWSFAAGEWDFEGAPIPILVNSGPMKRIDLCFVADKTDYTEGRGMLGDLEELIYGGYQTSNALAGDARELWQYYYAPETGFISSYDESVTVELPDAVWETKILDAMAVIHTTNKLDWAWENYFGTEPFNVGTALHESAHAVFNLGDEYPGGRQHASSTPHHNNYASKEEAEKYNVLMGWDETDVEYIEESWWRPEPKALECIMFDDQDAALPDFERTCILRIEWNYSLLALDTWFDPIPFP